MSDSLLSQVEGLKLVGWTADSAYNHLEGICDRELCTGDHSFDTFNPHQDRTLDGVLVVEGLKVKDYDFDQGVVVGDHTSPMIHELSPKVGHECVHWFKIYRLSDGHIKMMDASRLWARS